MFPAGLPGFALLMLRLAVAISGFATSSGAVLQTSWWIYGTCVTIGVALCIGVFTPLFAALSLVIQLCQFVLLWNDLEQRAVGILIAAALSLLGPGAFSVDSYRFGRRRVRFPEDDSPREH
jgi:uncharacterized membrane protein YphA (DoxX/SURF4 family)